MSSINLLIGDCTRISDKYEDREIVVLQDTATVFSPPLVGEPVESPIPGTLIACVIGNDAIVGYIEPINERRFRLCGEIFNYDEFDHFVIIQS